MTGEEFKRMKNDPEFKRLEVEAKELRDRLDAILIQINKDFPLDEGRKWCLNAAGTFGPYRPYSGRD